MRRWAWVLFWVLGVTWGSSFLLIRIGVQAVNPFQLVFIRVGIAAVGLHIALRLRGIPIPRDRETLLPLLLIGIGNPAIPFLLISWGETIIESSVASVLQSTASLFTLVIAHFFFADERMNTQRVGGSLVGFMGVIVLFGLNFEGGELLLNGLQGQLAVVVASMFYAVFATYSRVILKGKQVRPLVVAAMSMTSAAVLMGIATFAAPLFGGPAPVSLTTLPTHILIAVLTLGVFNTLFAYALFYFIIETLGASRATMVTYVVPVVGVILGVMFGNELLTVNLVVGAALILSGIGIANLPRRVRVREARAQT